MRRVEKLATDEFRQSLCGLSEGFSLLTFIGVGQGSGKTTALQAFLNAHAGGAAGVTSVGVDGAAQNGAAERSRAALTIPRGTIVATASGCIAHGDITHEILSDTGIHTPLGEVMLVMAHSGGWIELAGPSVVSDLVRVCGLLVHSGARRVFVDGAQGRLSLASPTGGGAAVFTVRHESTRSVEACAGDACRILEQLLLPSAPERALEQIRRNRNLPEMPKMLVIDEEPEKSVTYKSTAIHSGFFDSIGDATVGIWVRGAVTNEFADRLLGGSPAARNGRWAGLSLIIEDGTRLFLDERRQDRLRSAGIGLRVEQTVPVIGVAVNPGAGRSDPSAPPALLEAMAAATPLPLMDVIGGWYAAGV
ncbi:MAG TPA: hypothetical protein PKM25_09685 [Candidatus Ozemobacteraceae bacterium]|nr:hypothetical protein [Candidatus Ozemobacteraceae bacterium]